MLIVKVGKSSGSTVKRPITAKGTMSRSGTSLSLKSTETSKSTRSNTAENDDKIERKGVFKSNKKGTSGGSTAQSKVLSSISKDNEVENRLDDRSKTFTRSTSGLSLKSPTNNDGEVKMVVHLPRDLVCDTNQPTEVKLSIIDDSLITTKVSIGEQRLQRSKSDVSDKISRPLRDDMAVLRDRGPSIVPVKPPKTESGGMKSIEKTKEVMQKAADSSADSNITAIPSAGKSHQHHK